MSFLGPPPPPPRPAREQQRFYHTSPQERPENRILRALPWTLTMGRSEDTAVVATVFQACDVGVAFDLLVHLRPGTEYRHLDGESDWFDGSLHGLQFGVEDATGQIAVVAMSDDCWQRNSRAPTALHLFACDSGGDGLSSNASFWMWPLPPPGPLRFGCRWPQRNVADTEVVVDATELHTAASESVELWAMPASPDRSGGHARPLDGPGSAETTESVAWVESRVEGVAGRSRLYVRDDGSLTPDVAEAARFSEEDQALAAAAPLASEGKQLRFGTESP